MLAVFKRNFAAYFLNPTGYVFICVFVLLNSACAFLPDDFVNSNLANLAQLNRYFPYVTLIFIPAITMGIWTEERRNGTGELLLTSPLTAKQIVIGKYLAAVGIYSVSLLVSFGSNLTVLSFLGEPDFGLFASTYFGYWLIGLLMTAVGMFASFLTSQLTVAYILGGLLNVPLTALLWADALPFSAKTAEFLKAASVGTFFAPFGRGLISLSGILYFTLLPAAVLYFCLVLIEARSWTAKRPLLHLTHYLIRGGAAFLLAVSLIGIVRQYDYRIDATEERLSSLSPESLDLIDHFTSDYPTVIEAFLSPNVPSDYVQTRLDLIAVLNEIKSRLGNRVFLSIHSIQPNTEAAYQLEKRYDIRPKRVVFNTRGQMREESIFLTVLFRSGPKTIAIPFLNRGLSAEYELVSSLINVGNREKKRIGIVKTDASLFGRTDRFGEPLMNRWPIVDELARQYAVEEVDPSSPIPPNRYDALLAVQPSSLDPLGMTHLTAALARGDAAILFEDPYPLFVADFLAGTTVPKQANPAAGLYPTPKGDLGQLWSLLGILFTPDVLWKNYNPYPKLAGLSQEYLFVDARPISLEAVSSDEKSDSDSNKGKAVSVNSKRKEPTPSFCPSETSVSSLAHLLFPFAGYLVPNSSAGTEILPLIQTEAGGTASVEDVVSAGIQSRARKRIDRDGVYTLAARITGEIPRMFRRSEEGPIPQLNVILVGDVDLLTPGFFRLREMGNDVRSGVALDFDNVTFVLNAVDSIAGDEPFIKIRSRRPRHRTLTAIEDATRRIQDQASLAQIHFYKEFESEQQAEAEKMNKRIAELYNKGGERKEGNKLSEEESFEIQSAMVAMEDRLKAVYDEKKKDYDRKVEETQRKVDELTRRIQGRYKLYAVLFPPILPLFIGVAVYVKRRIARLKDRRERVR